MSSKAKSIAWDSPFHVCLFDWNHDKKFKEYKHLFSVLFHWIVLATVSLFSLETFWQGSFHFLPQNERIGLVRFKTSWKWAEYELCLWSAFISWPKRSFSEMSIFSLFSSWKRAFYKFGHRVFSMKTSLQSPTQFG